MVGQPFLAVRCLLRVVALGFSPASFLWARRFVPFVSQPHYSNCHSVSPCAFFASRMVLRDENVGLRSEDLCTIAANFAAMNLSSHFAA